ncbi:PREDICTED: protein PHYTOCHROME KINASE SUBSTRATE 1 [Ipomoea nil]|uniref:protein PHYTOCHROME KINASE SUBSTRATE 1 n=1 Tax=Ipomoea nil TaxID=35883 RepID=UPI0009018328|nr:PREDICTED: protein PHYTOCHROME KINASE SUBSTRATE 1 [Ipomoea nil]
MAMVVLTSEPNTKTTKAISFPSYLNCGDEESFELKIGVNPFISGTRKHVHLEANKAEDGEIDVFSAEKYFREAVEEEEEEEEEHPRNGATSTPKYHHNKKNDPAEEVVVVVDPVKPKSRPRTPSTRSESSWNSRSLLVQKVPRTDQQPKNSSRFGRKSFLASIGCNYCSCKDKNSLDVEEKKGEKPPLSRSRDSVEIKDFPVFYPRNGNQGANKKRLQEDKEEMKRNSIEVFGSPVLDNKPAGRKSFNLERRLTMVAWDAIAPRSETENPLSSNGIDYDTASEASSDLFEIESFPGSSNPFLPCLTPTTSYAPSEASIEWSVVTASAADFSVASDTEDPKTLSSSATFHRSIQNGRELVAKEKPKRLPSILLGCKSQKAVVVAGDAYRTASEKTPPGPGGARKHHSSEAFLPLTRFHAESKIGTGFGDRNAGSFSASISHREAHVLYI